MKSNEKTGMGKSEEHIEGECHRPYVVEKMGSGPAHSTATHKGGVEMERPRAQAKGPQVFKGL